MDGFFFSRLDGRIFSRKAVSVGAVVIAALSMASGEAMAFQSQCAANCGPGWGALCTTREQTVNAAANAVLDRSVAEDLEFMGGVLRSEDGYTYTVGEGVAGQDEITVTVRIPPGFQLVALWHTHGAPGSLHRYFSEVDTALVKRMKIPLYLAEASGRLRVFNPGDPTMSRVRSRRMGLGHHPGNAVGYAVSACSNKVASG